MQHKDRDPAYLWDMLEHARLAQEFVTDLSVEAYTRDRMRQLALERVLEVLGEAARRISSDFKEEHPEIPWRAIVGNRNVLAHEYGEIRQERLWETATVQVPELIRLLEPLIPEINEDEKKENT
jgi:uncharacterized protein with HEPN domain